MNTHKTTGTVSSALKCPLHEGGRGPQESRSSQNSQRPGSPERYRSHSIPPQATEAIKDSRERGFSMACTLFRGLQGCSFHDMLGQAFLSLSPVSNPKETHWFTKLDVGGIISAVYNLCPLLGELTLVHISLEKNCTADMHTHVYSNYIVHTYIIDLWTHTVDVYTHTGKKDTDFAITHIHMHMCNSNYCYSHVQWKQQRHREAQRLAEGR